MIPHGSYGGYQKCRRRPQGPCQPCRVANAAYHRSHRRANPDRYEVEKAQNAARTRALWKLAHLYPEEYRRLLDAETRAAAPKEVG